MIQGLVTHRFFFYLWVCCLLTISMPAVASGEETGVSASPPPTVALFISRSIRPYVEAADGFREKLGSISNADLEVFEVERFNSNSLMELADRLSGADLLVAVGPEAADFIWKAPAFSRTPKLYCIILNPDNIIDPDQVICGISLNIPPQYQLEMIGSSLPAARRIGLFFDPSQNKAFFEAAADIAPLLNIELVPLAVTSKKDIPTVLTQNPGLDCIWLIPDRTVISESIALYIIKQGILQNIPVVGYNQFFYESGAAMAFVFDYAALGRQAAELAQKVLTDQSCTPQMPVFQVWLNQSVIEKLGVKVSASDIPQVRFGP